MIYSYFHRMFAKAGGVDVRNAKHNSLAILLVAVVAAVRRVNSAEVVVPAELEPSYRNEFELVDTAKPQIIKKNPEYCERAQENLSTLDTYARIRIRDDQGEYRYDEDEKEAQREQARKLIDIHCE